MPVPVSALSVAVQGIADFLDTLFGEDVTISTDTPQRASERVKGGSKHFLNLFAYRIMPSGFHAAAADDQPFFIRINALLTPFPSDEEGTAIDADLRILGHAIRVLHSRPVIPAILPGASVDPKDFRSGPHLDYRLQAVLQAPSMEELNHIWTTQGGDLAYRLSAAYEFALIPVEPLEHGVEAGPVTTSIVDVQPDLEEGTAGEFADYSEGATAIPVRGIGAGRPPAPINWLPVVLIADGDELKNTAIVSSGAASVNLAIAGPPGERIAMEVSWVRADNSVDVQSPQVFTIASPSIDDPTATAVLTLENVSTGDTATVLTRPVDAAGTPLATSPFANTLSLATGGP